jgi:hypothetical protein
MKEKNMGIYGQFPENTPVNIYLFLKFTNVK